MYYSEKDSAGLYGVYSSIGLKGLLDKLNNEQCKLILSYIGKITKYRMTTVGYPGMDYMLSDCTIDLDTEKLKYILVHKLNGSEIVVDKEQLHNMAGGIGTIIDSYATEALESIKYVAYIVYNDSYGEYVTDHYPFIEDVFVDMLAYDELELLVKSFIDNKLILPKFLRDYFNSNIRDRYLKEKYEKSIRAILNSGKNTVVNEMYYNKDIWFIKSMREKIQSENDKVKVLELAARQVAFVDLYDGLSGHGKIDLNVMAKASKQDVYWMHAKNGDRIATVAEKKQYVSGIFKKEIYFLEPEKREKLLYFVWACYKDSKWIKKFSTFDNNTDVTSDEVWMVLADAVKYLRSSEFLKVDILELKKGLIEIKYLKHADDEVINKGESNKLKQVYNAFKDRTDSYSKMVADISKKALKYNTVLSEKQMNVINKAYDSIINTDDTYNKFNAQVLVKIQEILSFFDFKKTDFKYKLLTQVKDKKVCSIKQLDLINEWYDEYQEKKRSVISVDEIDDDFEMEDNTSVSDGIEVDDIDDGVDEIPVKNNTAPAFSLPSMGDLVWNSKEQ